VREAQQVPRRCTATSQHFAPFSRRRIRSTRHLARS